MERVYKAQSDIGAILNIGKETRIDERIIGVHAFNFKHTDSESVSKLHRNNASSQENLQDFLDNSVESVIEHYASDVPVENGVTPPGYTIFYDPSSNANPELFNDYSFGKIVGVRVKNSGKLDKEKIMAGLQNFNQLLEKDYTFDVDHIEFSPKVTSVDDRKPWKASLMSDLDHPNFVCVTKQKGDYGQGEYMLWAHVNSKGIGNIMKSILQKNPMSISKLIQSKEYNTLKNAAERNARRVLHDAATHVGLRVDKMNDVYAFLEDEYDAPPQMALPDVSATYNYFTLQNSIEHGNVAAWHSFCTSTSSLDTQGGVPVLGELIDGVAYYKFPRKPGIEDAPGHSLSVFAKRLSNPEEHPKEHLEFIGGKIIGQCRKRFYSWKDREEELSVVSKNFGTPKITRTKLVAGFTC